MAAVLHSSYTAIQALLDALRLNEAEALRRIDVQEQSASTSAPFMLDYERAIVYLAAGRYEAALEAAQRSCDGHPLGTFSWGLVELVEAASRCGERERAATAPGAASRPDSARVD